MYSKDIERKVAIKYFHVLEEDMEDISLVELAKKAKLKYEDVLIFFPYNHIINRQKFIKLFINYIDDSHTSTCPRCLSGAEEAHRNAVVPSAELRYCDQRNYALEMLSCCHLYY